MNDLFISYSRQNREHIHVLLKALEDKGLSIWIDLNDIPPSAEWLMEIRRAIENSETILIAISTAWVQSSICQEELKYALDLNKKIIPVLVSATPSEIIPPQISKLNWIFFLDNNCEDTVEIVIKAFKTDLEWVRHHSDLMNKTLEWENSNYSTDCLLSETQTENFSKFIKLAKYKEPKLTSGQTKFLDACHENHKVRSIKKTARRVRTQILGQTIGSLKGHTDSISTIDSSPDGLYLVTNESDRSVGVWHLPTKNQVTDMSKHEGVVLSARFTHDNKFVVSSDNLGAIWLWESQTGKPVAKFEGHAGAVKIATVSSDGKYMLTGGSDETLKLWNVGDGKLIWIFKEHKDEILAADFSPKTDLIASGSKDGTVRIWDFSVFNFGGSQCLIIPPTLPIQNISFTSINSILVILSGDDDISAWNAQNGELLFREKLFTSQ